MTTIAMVNFNHENGSEILGRGKTTSGALRREDLFVFEFFFQTTICNLNNLVGNS